MDISPIGVLGFKNQVLAGPGGEFDVFYAFKDRNTYYGLLVWGRGNDQKIVEQILSTFKFANQ